MAAQRAPKQWLLTRKETITSFQKVEAKPCVHFVSRSEFCPILGWTFPIEQEVSCWPSSWSGKWRRQCARRLTSYCNPEDCSLELMLGLIANLCPVVSRNTIVKTAESLRDIWQRLRQHCGFQSSGAHFLDLSLIKYELYESPEDLFKRIMAFFEDNLLSATGNISHHGQRPIDDEEVTPSLENTVVFLWLQLINPALP